VNVITAKDYETRKYDRNIKDFPRSEDRHHLQYLSHPIINHKFPDYKPMVSIDKVCALALAFPGAVEHPHFEKQAFKARGKRIFCTVAAKTKIACVKLSPVDQSVYCQIDPEMIYPVPNKWGKQGWTNVSLTRVPVSLMKELLEKAHEEVS